MSAEERIKAYIDMLNIQVVNMKPSEYAEKNRIVTSGSNHKGRWNYGLTPYMREIVDRSSPDDPARVVAIMGGSQLGKSHGLIFNAIAYYIANHPTNILLTCGDDALVKGAMGKLDVVFNDFGIKDLIRPTVAKKSNKKTGDTENLKEFAGGMLMAKSIQAVNSMKQDSFELIFLDDIENAAHANSKNVGDIVKLAFARATSYGDSYKIFLIGVPEIEQTSVIKPNYLKGDQRKFMLPCPCCGEYIEIVWYQKIEGEKEHAGVVFKTDTTGHLIESSVGYVCQKCGGFFKESKKQEMLQAGVWTPTAKPLIPDWYSYHLPALLAPRGFYGWTHYAYEWLDCFPVQGTVIESNLQHFKNHVLAETYEMKKKEVKANIIMKNIRDYSVGIIPDKLSIVDGNGEIMLVSCACDLNGFEDDARLDYEILAHAENGSTYSIDEGSIGTFERGKSGEDREKWTYRHGSPLCVWDSLREIITKFYVSESGKEYKIMITGIDTGAFTYLAYQFIDIGGSNGFIVGVKGDPTEKQTRLDANVRSFREAQERSDLYWIHGNFVKDRLSEFMKYPKPQDGYPQPAGFMNYPTPENGKYDFRYFEQYEGEVRRPQLNQNGIEISYAWEKISNSSKNHFWDCRVYNLALRDIFVKIISKGVGKQISWQEYCQMMK